jgi:two-component system sensor histidine kinase VicK
MLTNPFSMENKTGSRTHFFLKGGGGMGENIRSYDWENSVLGSPDSWPQSLRLSLSIILNSKFPMFLWWGKELIQFYNDAYRPSLGNEGKHPTALGQKGEECWPEIWPQIKPLIDQVLQRGEATWNENTYLPIYRNGKLEDVYWTFCYSPVYDESEQVAGILVTCNETTQTVLATQKIKEEEQNLRNIILQAPVAMCILHGENYVVEIANERMYSVWGTTAAQVLGKPIFECLPEAIGQGFETLLAQVYETGERHKRFGVPLTLPRNGKSDTIYVDFLYEAFRETNGVISGVIAIVVEVTDQVLNRKKIEEAEERARIAIESAELGFYEIDMQSREMIADTRLREIFGADPSTPRAKLIATIHPDDLTIRRKAFREALTTSHLNYEVRIIRENETLHWIKVTGKLTSDENGKPVKMNGVVQDITKVKEMEYQKDDFIGIVSHELKTPLTTLKAYAHILKEKFKSSRDGLTPLIAKMGSQVDRLHYIVQDLLDVTRIESNKIRFREVHFDFSELVSNIVEEIQSTNKTHQLIIDVLQPVCINADKERMSQVLTNLLTNAIRYSPEGSSIIVSTGLQDGEMVCSIKDFGRGIPKESQVKIFERFFQVSEINRSNAGFGLGLYISAQIIKRQNGKIWVESELGKGSTFYLSMPAVEVFA